MGVKEAQEVCLGYKPMFEINVFEDKAGSVFGLGGEGNKVLLHKGEKEQSVVVQNSAATGYQMFLLC